MSIRAALSRLVARLRRRPVRPTIYVSGDPFSDSPRQRARRIATALSKDPT